MVVAPICCVAETVDKASRSIRSIGKGGGALLMFIYVFGVGQRATIQHLDRTSIGCERTASTD